MSVSNRLKLIVGKNTFRRIIMSNLIVVGSQWGDEGKGKITDYFTDRCDMVVRSSGGNNAGHTVMANGIKYKLHLIPSGLIQNKPSIIGSGVVIDPTWIVQEMETLRGQGVKFDKLVIDKRAHVIMPYHRYLDELIEKSLGKNDIGTTKRGIGPAYTDKTSRSGIRICDLIDTELFREKLKINLDNVNRVITGVYDGEPMDFDEIFEEYTKCADQIRQYVADATVMVYDYIKKGKKVLFEGAQATLLDIDYGTYPYVTSSHPTASGACLGCGIGPAFIDDVCGIAKAYTTRVGKGPFPTELFDEFGTFLREKGFEYGTTTGRPRRCGWLDVVILKFAVRINSLTSLVFTKLDTLTGLEKIKLCVGYRYKGEIITDFPPELTVLAECEPVYEEFDGWTEDITKVKKYEDLPENARKYVDRVEELCECPIGIVSVGPDRNETIIRQDYLK